MNFEPSFLCASQHHNLETAVTMKLLTSALLLCSVALTAAAPIKGLLKKSNIPSTGQEWISVAPNAEVQPADFTSYSPEKAAMMQNTLNRMLEGSGSTKSEYNTLFLDGGETYYDDYAQAWRLLGFYIDCNAQGDDNDGDGCMRYLLWAAVSSTLCL